MLEPGLRLFVDFAPVGDARHIDRLSVVVNLVHGSVITDADAPFVITTLKLFGSPAAEECLLDLRGAA